MKNLKMLSLLIIVISMTYCTKETSVNNDSDSIIDDYTTHQKEVSPETLAKLESMGFDIKTTPPVQHGNDIFVEGEILLSEKLILENDAKNSFSSDSFFTARLVSCDNVRNIRVMNTIDPNADHLVNTSAGLIASAVPGALELWNNVSGSIVKFVLVDSNPDVKIYAPRPRVWGNTRYHTYPNVPTYTALPYSVLEGQNREPTPRTLINPYFTTTDGISLSKIQWRNIIARQLGSVIGFVRPGPQINTILNRPIEVRNRLLYTSQADLNEYDKEYIRRAYNDTNDRFCVNK